MRTTDRVTAVLLAALAVFALAWFIPTHTSPAQSRLDLAPALLPSIAMAVVGAMAVLLLWSRRRPADSGHTDEEYGDEASGIGRHELVNLGLCLAAGAVTYALMTAVGFVVAGALLAAAGMWHARLRNRWLLVGLAVGVPAVLDRVAWYAFTILLP